MNIPPRFQEDKSFDVNVQIGFALFWYNVRGRISHEDDHVVMKHASSTSFMYGASTGNDKLDERCPPSRKLHVGPPYKS